MCPAPAGPAHAPRVPRACLTTRRGGRWPVTVDEPSPRAPALRCRPHFTAPGDRRAGTALSELWGHRPGRRAAPLTRRNVEAPPAEAAVPDVEREGLLPSPPKSRISSFSFVLKNVLRKTAGDTAALAASPWATVFAAAPPRLFPAAVAGGVRGRPGPRARGHRWGAQRPGGLTPAVTDSANDERHGQGLGMGCWG